MAHPLVESWNREADALEKRGLHELASMVRSFAQELCDFESKQASEPLTLTAAAALCGYSTDTLRRYINEGLLGDYGQPNAPRVRRGDLPRKLRGGKKSLVPRTESGLPDLAADVLGKDGRNGSSR